MINKKVKGKEKSYVVTCHDTCARAAEASEEDWVWVASGLWISQLLVMEWAAMDPTETGVLTGMFGGDVVEEAEAEVIGWFS